MISFDKPSCQGCGGTLPHGRFKFCSHKCGYLSRRKACKKCGSPCYGILVGLGTIAVCWMVIWCSSHAYMGRVEYHVLKRMAEQNISIIATG